MVTIRNEEAEMANLNKEWVTHIFKDVSTNSENPFAAEVVTPFGWYARFNMVRLETWSDMIQALLGEVVIPKKGTGAITLDGLCLDRHGRAWGTMKEAEELVVLGKAAGLLDYGLPKFGRVLPMVFLEP